MLLKSRFIRVAAVGFLISLTAPASFGMVDLRCSIETPVYDSRGYPVAFSVESITRVNAGIEMESLLSEGEPRQIARRSGRLAFSEALIGVAVKITLRIEGGLRLSRTIELRDCRGRASFQYGSESNGGIAAGSRVKGRIVGCLLAGDWWVRLFPMFGGYGDVAIDEAPVDASTGLFSFTTSMPGRRQLLIVGRGQNPIKAVGINITEGANNDVGRLDIQLNCPK